MSDEPLTRDNPQLSRFSLAADEDNRAVDLPEGPNARSCAIDCTDQIPAELLRLVESLVEDSLSPNTHRAYQADLAHFEAWGGRLPAAPIAVAGYLAANAAGLSVATLLRRVASISKAHSARGYPNPCRAEIVRATLRGIRRRNRTAQRQAKPLLQEELILVLDATGSGLRDLRDRALLLLGFAGGFRRSELVRLDTSDIALVQRGLIITLGRSKTDQEGAGRKIAVPLGRTQHCPVAALTQWFSASGIADGAIFRRVHRSGRLLPERLSAEAVSLIIKSRIAAVGIDPSLYSGHSLRAGLSTSAGRAGVPTWKIRAQTGHVSDAMLGRYIRDGQLFTDNASGALL